MKNLSKLILMVSIVIGLNPISTVFSEHEDSPRRAYKCGVVKGLLFSAPLLSEGIRRSLVSDIRLGTCGLAYYHGLLRSAIEGGRGLQDALSELADSSVFNGDDAEDEMEELSDDIQDQLNDAEDKLENGNQISVVSTLGTLVTFYGEEVNEKLERIAREYCESK